MFVKCPSCGATVDGPARGSATCPKCTTMFSIRSFLEPGAGPPAPRPRAQRPPSSSAASSSVGVAAAVTSVPAVPPETIEEESPEPSSFLHPLTRTFREREPAAPGPAPVPDVSEDRVRLPFENDPTLGPFVAFLRRTFGIAMLGSTALYGLVLALMLVTLVSGLAFVPGAIYTHPEFQEVLFLIVPVPVGFAALGGGALVAYYLLLVGAIVGSAGLMVRREGRATLQLFRDRLRTLTGPRRLEQNGLVLLTGFFLAVLAFDYLWYVIVLPAFHTEPRVPPFEETPEWQLFVGFAHASVWEEVAARVVLIGFPLLLLAAWRRRNRPLAPGEVDDPLRLSMRALRFLFGGQGRITDEGVIFVIISASFFGLAHVPGWDYSKIVPVIVSGVAFGYLYLMRGLHLAILYHFSFDYLGLMETHLFTPSGGSLPGVVVALILIQLVWLAVGAVLFILYSWDVLRFLRRFLLRADQPAAAHPRTAGTSPGEPVAPPQGP